MRVRASALHCCALLLVAAGTASNLRDNDQTSQTNTLSAPSVFWAIVALAISTTTQPTGRIIGLPFSWSIALKASPCLCIVDTGVALFVLLANLITHGAPGIRKGLQLIADLRYADLPEAEVGFTSLHESRLRVALFVLGTMPQFVKICSCRHIPFTQVIAAFFIGRFVLEEIIGFYMNVCNICPEQDGVTDDRLFPRILAVMIISIPLVVVTLLKIPTLEVVVILVFCITLVIALFPPLHDLELAVIMVILEIPLCLGFILNSICRYPHGHGTEDAETKATLTMGVTLFLWLQFRYMVNGSDILPKLPFENIAVPILITFGQVFTEFLGLIRLYEASSTMKPAWTEYLG